MRFLLLVLGRIRLEHFARICFVIVVDIFAKPNLKNKCRKKFIKLRKKVNSYRYFKRITMSLDTLISPQLTLGLLRNSFWASSD